MSAGVSALDLLGRSIWELFTEPDGSHIKEDRLAQFNSSSTCDDGFLIPGLSMSCKKKKRQCDLRFR